MRQRAINNFAEPGLSIPKLPSLHNLVIQSKVRLTQASELPPSGHGWREQI
jgi:hypothetical protein